MDSLIVIPNDRLSAVCTEEVTVQNAFTMADDVLNQGVQAIAELVTVPGEINLDFADVKTVMSGAGPAWMGIGYGAGEMRAVEAANAAVACPLLEVAIDGSKGVLFNIAGGENLTLMEVQTAADCISQVVDPDANIFFGMVTDPQLADGVRITIIATGFPSTETLNSAREQDLAKLVAVPTGGGPGVRDRPASVLAYTPLCPAEGCQPEERRLRQRRVPMSRMVGPSPPPVSPR